MSQGLADAVAFIAAVLCREALGIRAANMRTVLPMAVVCASPSLLSLTACSRARRCSRWGTGQRATLRFAFAPLVDRLLTREALKEVARCVKTNTPSGLLGGDLARDAIVLCHKQTESVVKGRPVKV